MSSELVFAIPGIAFSASLGLNTALAALARRINWCDRPAATSSDGQLLKIHRSPVPLAGGAGLFLILAAAAIALQFWRHPLAAVIDPARRMLRLAGAGGFALFAGLLDDIFWKDRSVPLLKLAAQSIAACGAWFLLRTGGIADVALPVGAGLMAIGMNAFNLEDGMDGLLSGETTLSCVGFALVLHRLKTLDMALLALVLAAALAGILLLNWHPAIIFLGDSGSHLLGMLISCFALATLHIAAWTPRHLLGATLLVGLPLFDLLFVLLNRIRRRRPLFAGGRDHLYDIIGRWTTACSLHYQVPSGLSASSPVVIPVLLMMIGQAVSVAAGVFLLTGGLRV